MVVPLRLSVFEVQTFFENKDQLDDCLRKKAVVLTPPPAKRLDITNFRSLLPEPTVRGCISGNLSCFSYSEIKFCLEAETSTIRLTGLPSRNNFGQNSFTNLYVHENSFARNENCFGENAVFVELQQLETALVQKNGLSYKTPNAQLKSVDEK